VRRFITLIDCLYEARTRVVLLAAAEPKGCFVAGTDAAQDEVFAFDRTVSRLLEMQGADYKDRCVWWCCGQQGRRLGEARVP
jgi:cell division protein ZapE